MTRTLYDASREHSSCGVGFITNKRGEQTQELLQLSHQALCKIPHRGGMSAEGIGDGAGVNIDLSLAFFRHLCSDHNLQLGDFGVGNFFLPITSSGFAEAEQLIRTTLANFSMPVLLWRKIPVNSGAVNVASLKAQLPLYQVVFGCPQDTANVDAFADQIDKALLDIEAPAFTRASLNGLYPLSMSCRTQVYKGRLNSWEVMPYFEDLSHPQHQVHTLFFHTRFSTNTAPNPMFAQPFRRMAHNGELNTDKKNRLSEDAIARQNNNKIIFPPGQSDSARLDQTLGRRVLEDRLDIDEAILAMMPPAWENDASYSGDVRAMLEYFSLCEEKNDGPAALIFSDGIKVGARLDRLGLRPLRSVQTETYLAVMSEAGQIDFPPEDVISRGRIEAGGMLVFNHQTSELLESREVMQRLAGKRDYPLMLAQAKLRLEQLPQKDLGDYSKYCASDPSELGISARHVGYGMNQESFKFLLDPMLQSGGEKISAMGYGLAPNALAGEEGGMSRYFSQRFAQVTNPPLDSIREADGMTLRVALGGKPNFRPDDCAKGRQLVLDSPILQPQQLQQMLCAGDQLRVELVDTLYVIDPQDRQQSQANLEMALESVCSHVEALARSRCDVIVLSDQNLARDVAAIPAVLAIAAVNQRLINQGLRFNSSVVFATGQAASTHDIAVLLGFGASAIMPLTVYHRALELFSSDAEVQVGLNKFQKAVEKSLMKTMGKFGLCTVESYIGGEFFEANFIDTNDARLRSIFPNIHSPVGGARFIDIANSSFDWHLKLFDVSDAKQIPLLGLFKERSEGAGHSFGNTAVREYISMTEEEIVFSPSNRADSDAELLDEPPIVVPQDDSYRDQSFQVRTPEEIDGHAITTAYKSFSSNLYKERANRPATLRDVLALPLDFSSAQSSGDFALILKGVNSSGNIAIAARGLRAEFTAGKLELSLLNAGLDRHRALGDALSQQFGAVVQGLEVEQSKLSCFISVDSSAQWLTRLLEAPDAIDLQTVQPAHEITRTLASGAMSHGALVAKAHEAVAMGTNIAGAMSNSGEGGESSGRYNSVRASKIKQFASGRFGVWTGYLADPCLQEIEIKMAQGAKPGEGGQLPAAKVNVEIASARGCTPGIELVSPPPHHDTYSIEDLGQLIHDAKAARVRVVVKLVSSEGVGTIAVGVAKAGADVINIAGNTGGTGAAQVTSLKNTGRVAELGIAEVHQALAENGLRDKVTLRCSNAHQTGLDVVKSALMGGDSFEFGTTALMMLKCVMAKNCNVKCPAGLTTNAELYQGDPRALAQYFLNLAHEVREILADLGYSSLREIRGRTNLLHLIEHQRIVGRLDMSAMLRTVDEVKIDNPIYLEADFSADNRYLIEFHEWLKNTQTAIIAEPLTIKGPVLNNCNKTTGGQFAIDVERYLNYSMSAADVQMHPAVRILSNGRRVLGDDMVVVVSSNSAGQSFGAFNNTGINLVHSGTCNDGVGKGMSGGRIAITNPGGNVAYIENVLVGNFALFGATGGQLYVVGQAGDRFGVRNSGAVAVVEGVGDFCCEYMTNGSIVNLGDYGKGFGNGMSGGSAYQYDPQHQLLNSCSRDSVVALSLSDDTDLARGQEQALLLHLQEHINQTGSSRASKLIADWDESRKHFYFVIPRALFSYHCSEQILEAMGRKAMLDEMATASAEFQLTRLASSYQTELALFDHKVPGYGARDTDLICAYVNVTGVMRRALEQAQKLGIAGQQALDVASRQLVLNRDRKLLETLAKDAREALANFSDAAMAALLAEKRVNDYKSALSQREVADSLLFGTSVWILARDRANAAELADFESVEKKLAEHYSHVLADFIRVQVA